MPLLEPDNRFRLPHWDIESIVSTALAESMDWGLKFAHIPTAWKESKGDGIRVAVLDTGVDQTHPDLREAIEDAQDFSGSPFGVQDRDGHGTHTAGTIGARQNNTGVVGVAPLCRLLIGKVLGDDGSGSGKSVAAGIDWALSEGADILSMSLGSSQPDPVIHAALARAVAAGKFVICAAGNDGRPNSVGYPAAWDDLSVAVGAVDERGKLANFSSRGRQVDIAAPGVNILSTFPGGRYAKLSGTSMATPFVAGVVALALAKHRKLATAKTPLVTQADLLGHLRATAIDAGTPGHDHGFGFGLVNPAGLLAEAVEASPAGPVPGVPFNGVTVDLSQYGLPIELHLPAAASDLLTIGAALKR